jgi:hypothetical protein
VSFVVAKSVQAAMELLAATGTVKVVVVDETWTPTEVEFLAAVPSGARIGDPTPLGSVAWANGTLTAADTTYPNDDTGTGISALVVFIDTGAEATSRVLAVLARSADYLPFSAVTSGDDLLLAWPDGEIATF